MRARVETGQFFNEDWANRIKDLIDRLAELHGPCEFQFKVRSQQEVDREQSFEQGVVSRVLVGHKIELLLGREARYDNEVLFGMECVDTASSWGPTCPRCRWPGLLGDISPSEYAESIGSAAWLERCSECHLEYQVEWEPPGEDDDGHGTFTSRDARPGGE